MKASEVAIWLEWMMRIGCPAFITGEPGVGKTSVVNQVNAKLKRRVMYTRLALCDSVDLRGIPVTDLKAGVTRWLTPSDFPREGCPDTTWFMDEWMQGLPSVQAAAGQLLHERMLGDYRLPDNVYICGASNRAKDRAA